MASLRDEIGDFVGIPNSFMEDERQTAESRVVFMVLRYHTHKKKKRAFPGYETLMKESGLSRQKTAAGIKALVESGWLVKHKQFAKVTEYELQYPTTRYSSTGELRDGVALVPPANAVSSTMEQPPYVSEQEGSNKKERGAQDKPRKTLAPVDPPFHGVAFMSALALFDAVQRENKKSLGVTRRKLVYDKLSVWDEATATKSLLEAAEAGWPFVYYPKNGNGKGQSNERPVWMAAEK